jgi:integrase
MDPEVMKKIAARKLRLGQPTATTSSRPRRALADERGELQEEGLNKAVKNAGIERDARVTPHDSRHAYASALASTGCRRVTSQRRSANGEGLHRRGDLRALLRPSRDGAPDQGGAEDCDGGCVMTWWD